MNTKENQEKWLRLVKDTLEIGGRSSKTYENYKSHIKRFLNYYDKDINIKKLKEEEILQYIKINYLNKGLADETYNMAIKAIKYYYSICFQKELNSKLLPNVKLKKKMPTIIEKPIFIKIFNEEKSLKHKCWLLLAFCSGLRVEEVATVKIENIYPDNHKLKVLGKGKKERFTILPDITIKILNMYLEERHITQKKGYLFKGNAGHEVINSNTIVNYFTSIKEKYDLDDNITFHSLRHSFATYYLSNGGSLLALQSMLGHRCLSTTTIYIHISQNFNQLEGIKYV